MNTPSPTDRIREAIEAAGAYIDALDVRSQVELEDALEELRVKVERLGPDFLAAHVVVPVELVLKAANEIDNPLGHSVAGRCENCELVHQLRALLTAQMPQGEENDGR